MNYTPPTHAILYLRGSSYKAQAFWSHALARRWLDEAAEDGTYALVNLSTGGLAGTFVVSSERTVRQVA